MGQHIILFTDSAGSIELSDTVHQYQPAPAAFCQFYGASLDSLGIWRLYLGIWRLDMGISQLCLGIWWLFLGICHLYLGMWRLYIGI